MLRHDERLAGVHPDLVRVVRRCGLSNDFFIIQGLRTIEEERQNVARGASTTMHSRHLPGKAGFACAVDLGALNKNGHYVPGNGQEEYHLYELLAVAMKVAAHLENVPIEWGGDWVTFKDGGHFQLPWAQYP